MVVRCDAQTHHDQKLFYQGEDAEAEAEDAEGRSDLQTG